MTTTATSPTPAAHTAATAEPCTTPPRPGTQIEPPDDDTLAAMAKAIAHPARIAILRILSHHEACVTGDVVAELPLAQSTISEHLRILRQAGLVQGEIEGPRTRYCINTNGLSALRAGIATL
ncbi:MAG: ArsR/SmtB family transcription factor [Acidimicrobiales bacterium]